MFSFRTDGRNQAQVSFQLGKSSFGLNVSSLSFNQFARKPEIKRVSTPSIQFDSSTGVLTGWYRDRTDFDLIKIDREVTSYLKKLGNTSNLERELENLRKEGEQPMTKIKRRKHQKKEKELQEKIDRFSQLYHNYYQDTSEIIYDYSLNRSLQARDSIVSCYLRISRRYIRHDLTVKNNDTRLCTGCQHQLDPKLFSQERLICQYCGCINPKYNKVVISGESGFGNRSQHNNKNEETFIKALDQFMCRQKVTINEEVFQDLDAYFQRQGYPTREGIEQQPLIREGTKLIRPGTSVRIMTEGLENCHYSKYYPHVRYLSAKYWKWKLDDLEHLYSDIMIRYRITLPIYTNIKEGSSNLKADFHLYKILRSMRVECYLSDFKPVKVSTTLQTYLDYWNQIEEEIKNNPEYHYYFGNKINWYFD